MCVCIEILVNFIPQSVQLTISLHWFRNDSASEQVTSHDDVIKCKHFSRYWPFVPGTHRSPVNSSHRGQWRGALMLSLICARINGWVNNRKAGDLRRHRAHYDVILMRQAIVSSNDGLTTVIYASLGLVEFVRSRDNFLYMGANSKWRVRFRRHFNVWRHPDTTIIWYWMGTPQQFEICVASGKWAALRTR